LQGPLAFKPGVAGTPVAVPVPIPVVVPGVVLEIPRGAAILGEDTPPLTPAELLPAVPGATPTAAPPAPAPAPNAQLEDTASAAAITIVVIFMTFVSLFMVEG
jgi:hypothetical protein